MFIDIMAIVELGGAKSWGCSDLVFGSVILAQHFVDFAASLFLWVA